ncbi:MAG: WecB/TagA/CpsF family glycosyltransferase [Candidatus Omnitrophica bacterium]|nr:WecB/TagA/CpsF family glycosyltransferase [Candidatus Omnitrophota bacterium]
MKLKSPVQYTGHDNPLDFFEVLGVKVNVTNLELACQTIQNWIIQNQKVYVCCAPVSTILDGYKDRQYREVINNSGMTTPDGIPLVWLGRLHKKDVIKRTYGPDLMLRLCETGQNKSLKHYFFGGSEESSTKLKQRLIEQFSDLKIAGSFVPSLRRINEIEAEAVIEQINRAQPDVLWVGLGSPKQDYWMANHRDKLDAPVIIGVGAAFDFLSGCKKQAPRWMQRSGLEWLFRLCSEPRRLWKRYLLGNALFLTLLIRNYFFPQSRQK